MKGTQNQPFQVSVLLHQDGHAWVAQCLQRDLAAQGRTEEEAKNRFREALGAQIAWDLLEGRTPLGGLPQAPKRYFMDSVTAGADGPELPVFVPVLTAVADTMAEHKRLGPAPDVSVQFLKKTG